MLSSRPRRVWGHIFGGLIMVKFTKAAQKVGGKLADGWGDPPPPGLEPIGDGWYRSPEVVDPRDCNNYPDSPWCGGNPLTRDPAALDIDIGFDECHVHATMSGALGFIKLPRHTISYVRPECVEDYERKRNPPPPNPSPETPGTTSFTYPLGLDPNAEVFAFYCDDSGSNVIANFASECSRVGLKKVTATYIDKRYAQFTSISCPGDFCQVQGSYMYGMESSGPITSQYTFAGGVVRDCPQKDSGESRLNNSIHKWDDGDILFVYDVDAEGRIRGYYEKGNKADYVFVDRTVRATEEIEFYTNTWVAPAFIIKGKWGTIIKRLTPGGAKKNEYLNRHVDFVVKIDCSSPALNNNPPPPPPPPDCCKDMACCPQPKSQPIDNSLLLQILDKLGKLEKAIGVFPANATVFDINESAQGAQTQTITVGSLSQAFQRTIERIEKISKIIGIDDFPIEVPDTLVEPANKGILGSIFTFLFGTKTRKINNLTGFMAWQLEQDSAILGKWHQEIFVQDTDATKKGNQSKTMVVPDISSALKEILLLQISAIKILGLINDVSIKNIVETSGTKLLAAEIASRTIDIQQFLDYPTTEKIEEVGIQITPPPANGSKVEQNDLYKILQSSKAKYKFDDWTGEHSFHDMMIDLLQAAKAIMVNYSQKR